MNAQSCPKCAQQMEDGFVIDCTHGAVLASTWLEGRPERSFWTGIKLKGRRRLAITTYRCVGCGYLESYANE